jgi:hypothetical protein
MFLQCKNIVFGGRWATRRLHADYCNSRESPKMTTPNAVHTRLLEILRRHTQPDDIHLTDHDFIMRVFWRYQEARDQPLIDPNE